MTLDAHYITPRLAAVYDAECGWSEDRQFYLELAGPNTQAILDFGCGTGLIANAYARAGHKVTGADPAPAMLDVARQSEMGAKIDWVEATSQSFKSDKQFDLIIMTGHAFQVLLEEQDVAATLGNVRELLKPDGRFVFETRYPLRNWADRWTHQGIIDTSFGPVTITRRVLRNEAQRIVFTTHYAFADAEFSSESELRFWSEAELAPLISEAGLKVTAFYGDWHKGAFDPATSDEMVYELRRA